MDSLNSLTSLRSIGSCARRITRGWLTRVMGFTVIRCVGLAALGLFRGLLNLAFEPGSLDFASCDLAPDLSSTLLRPRSDLASTSLRSETVDQITPPAASGSASAVDGSVERVVSEGLSRALSSTLARFADSPRFCFQLVSSSRAHLILFLARSDSSGENRNLFDPQRIWRLPSLGGSGTEARGSIIMWVWQA